MWEYFTCKKKNHEDVVCISLSAPLLKQKCSSPSLAISLSSCHTHTQIQSSMVHDVKRDVTAIQELLPLQWRSRPIEPCYSSAEGPSHLVGPCQRSQLLSLSAKHSWHILMAGKRVSAISYITGLRSSLRTGVL